MAESPPITGRCLCGRVRFEVSEPLLEAEYCHCKRCQRRTGTTASASALTAPGTFRVTEGKELLGAFKPDDGWHDYFCRECGGHLYGQSHEDPRLICVPMGQSTVTPACAPRSISTSPTPHHGTRSPTTGSHALTSGSQAISRNARARTRDPGG